MNLDEMFGLFEEAMARGDAAEAVRAMQSTMAAEHRSRTGTWARGQLWQECIDCGGEPCCMNCFKCRRHCMCEERDGETVEVDLDVPYKQKEKAKALGAR